MKVIRLHEPRQLSLEDLEDPTPGPHQVLLAVEACGVCGTDLHAIEGNNPLTRFPVTPGHEFSGTVIDVGLDVSRLRIDDRVAVDPSCFCGTCAQCRAGWHNLCPYKGGYGSAKDGGFAERVVVDEQACALVPATLDLALATLTEPLSCVLHGIDRIGPVLGERVLVYGAGAIGLMTSGLLKVGGAAEVDVIDTATTKLGLAATFGATDTATSVAELNRKPKDGWHVVVDATGAAPAIEDALTRVRKAGRMLMLGVAPPGSKIQLEPFTVNWHELTILGSMAVRHTFSRALGLLDHHQLPYESLISGEFPLTDFDTAISSVRTRAGVKFRVRP